MEELGEFGELGEKNLEELGEFLCMSFIPGNSHLTEVVTATPLPPAMPNPPNPPTILKIVGTQSKI